MVAANVKTNALDAFGTRSPSKKNPLSAMRAAKALYGLKKVSLAEFSGQPANDDLHVANHIRVGEDPTYSTVYGELKHDGGGTGTRIDKDTGYR